MRTYSFAGLTEILQHVAADAPTSKATFCKDIFNYPSRKMNLVSMQFISHSLLYFQLLYPFYFIKVIIVISFSTSSSSFESPISATFLKLMIKIQKYFWGKIMEKNLHYNFIINYNKVAEKIESVQRFKFQNESVTNRWKRIFI